MSAEIFRELKGGYTTGTNSAAAAVASAEYLFTGHVPVVVSVTLPGGEETALEVFRTEDSAAGFHTVKDAGDDPDVTHGAKICAEVFLEPGNGTISIEAGEGVGTITKKGLQGNIGDPAVNPVPQKMIKESVAKVFAANNYSGSARVVVSIPGGRELALKTLNPHLGIIGGLSILGTTGKIKPMSEEAYKISLLPQLDVARAEGLDYLVMTPGNIGRKYALEAGYQEKYICETSNYIGFMLEEAYKRDFRKIVLVGHIGKITKVAAGNFHTHNRVSDARFETIVTLLALSGCSRERLEEILECRTTDAAASLTEEWGMDFVWTAVADRAARRMERFLFGEIDAGVIVMKNRGEFLASDSKANTIGGGFNEHR